MKSIITFLLFCLIVINSPLLGQTGEISGYIYNGSIASMIVRGISVKLLVYQGRNIIDDSTHIQQTNNSGQYIFQNIPVDTSITYFPMVIYKSILYYGRGVRIGAENLAAQSDVVIYDTTSQKTDITVPFEHLFLNVEQGKLSLREIFIIKNNGNRTFIGQKFNQTAGHYVLKFPLPQGFQEFELLTQLPKNSVFVNNNMLHDLNFVPPGIRKLSFRFVVPYNKKVWQLTRSIFYPTRSMNIYVDNHELVLESPGLTDRGDFKIHDTDYHLYSVQDLIVGKEFVLSVKNLPFKSIPVQWMVLFLVILLLIIGFGYTLKKSSSK